MNLNESIIKIRCELQKSKLKKSGQKYNGYFELSDFLPKLNELMEEEKVNDMFTIEDNQAKLTLIKGEEKQSYTIPFILFETPISKQGYKMMQDIQYLGALNTYYKRYLYINAFGITDVEIINTMDDGMQNIEPQQQATTAKATERQIQKVKELVNDIPGMLQFYKIEKIEDLTLLQASEIIAKKSKGE